MITFFGVGHILGFSEKMFILCMYKLLYTLYHIYRITDRYINFFINAITLPLQFFNAVQCDSTYSYIIELHSYKHFINSLERVINPQTINVSTN